MSSRGCHPGSGVNLTESHPSWDPGQAEYTANTPPRADGRGATVAHAKYHHKKPIVPWLAVPLGPRTNFPILTSGSRHVFMSGMLPKRALCQYQASKGDCLYMFPVFRLVSLDTNRKTVRETNRKTINFGGALSTNRFCGKACKVHRVT